MVDCSCVHFEIIEGRNSKKTPKSNSNERSCIQVIELHECSCIQVIELHECFRVGSLPTINR